MGRSTLFWLPLLGLACGEQEGPPAPPPCGSLARSQRTLIAGPGQDGYEEALAAKARRHDRLFSAVFSKATGLNADFSATDTTAATRAPFEQFAKESEAWDFQAATGVDPKGLGRWEKSAGLYGGAGLAADAYRYGTLRDAGEACEEVEQARAQLLRGLEGLDLAARIGGVPGVTARSLINRAYPDGGHGEPLPLFDANGQPLPAEKNNGEWRDDQTGRYPDWIWEDSLSRDMLVGWAMAYGAAWEVGRDDDSIPAELKARLKEDALATARALMKVRDSGYDLEIPDADGRLTFHAYLNENVIDRIYLPGANNGFYAIMALGIVAALAAPAADAEIDHWLAAELIEKRNLPKLANDEMLIDLGTLSNFSNYNMAFTAMWLAQRFVTHPNADGFLSLALDTELYDKAEGDHSRQPNSMGQSFYDIIYVAGHAGCRYDTPCPGTIDQAALERGLSSLRQYADAPFFDHAVENCDAAEIAAQRCQLLDGSTVDLLDDMGRGETLIAKQAIPMAVRPPSNYHWRSNPYQPNGGSPSSRVLPAVDFRVAYWMGRFVRVGVQ